VIGEATRRLLGQLFRLNELGAHRAKGFAEQPGPRLASGRRKPCREPV
jgi:hypothetical protein